MEFIEHLHAIILTVGIVGMIVILALLLAYEP